MNLKPRFLLLTTVLLLLSGAGIWMLSQQIALNVLQSWAIRHFETQVRLEKERSLQPIIREVALARQFADSQILRNWARDPADPKKKARALEEMEAFRSNFADHSYFVALLNSGDYYHNNATNEFAGREYRYTLRPDNPDDRWFYSIIGQNRDIHLNVNPDIPLGVTKLWIDVLLRDGDKVLGVVGTGLDLTTYIRQVSTTPEPGIDNLFFDHEGAIQISRDLSQIDFATITKAASEKKTVWQQLDHPNERQQLQQSMQKARQQPGTVQSMTLSRYGERHLAGVVYLPEVDWFVITFLDIDQLLPLSTFNGIFILAGISILLALVLYNLALNRYVLTPLNQLEKAITLLRAGKPCQHPLPVSRRDEISRLVQHFDAMSNDVIQSRRDLEQRVQERTEELEKLSRTDTLTGLLNRRGMNSLLYNEYERMQREGTSFGLLWLDLDHFKAINDRYGHELGDRALIGAAHQLQELLRPYDYAARWGGDEFLILIQTHDRHLLEQMGQRIGEAVAARVRLKAPDNSEVNVTLSIGSYLASQDDSIESMLAAADGALYQAKAAGRNTFRSGNV